jgi:hypothetical protein
VEKFSGAREAANDSMVHTRCVLGKQGYAHAHAYARMYTQHTQKCVTLIIFQCNNGFKNAPHCCVKRTLPVLFL